MSSTFIRLNKDRGGSVNLLYKTAPAEKSKIKVELYLCDEHFVPADPENPSIMYKDFTEEEFHRLIRSGYTGHVDENKSSNPEWNQKR